MNRLLRGQYLPLFPSLAPVLPLVVVADLLAIVWSVMHLCACLITSDGHGLWLPTFDWLLTLGNLWLLMLCDLRLLFFWLGIHAPTHHRTLEWGQRLGLGLLLLCALVTLVVTVVVPSYPPKLLAIGLVNGGMCVSMGTLVVHRMLHRDRSGLLFVLWVTITTMAYFLRCIICFALLLSPGLFPFACNGWLRGILWNALLLQLPQVLLTYNLTANSEVALWESGGVLLMRQHLCPSTMNASSLQDSSNPSLGQPLYTEVEL
eukprot:NODE_4052_length_849_cov_16.088643_g3895_i0.p1 GENE.NODE_4052_length_849_cov_16.088643_g3895_i0~~NODE_4052_length_849_cov_16.088643_g3895_i0.p1  ORF type:complete len:270 (+),score=53.65 NODE_4052_length_849_cov_16.088643_g3895_i0:30-812(+)